MEKPHLLLVDDDEAFTTMLSLYLRRLGYTTDAVTDSATAMRAMNSREYDAVIVDLTMPEVDGLSLVQEIRSRFEALPVIIYTGWGYDDQKMREALRVGANAYVSKNITVDEVVSALGRVVRRRDPVRPGRKVTVRFGSINCRQGLGSAKLRPCPAGTR